MVTHLFHINLCRVSWIRNRRARLLTVANTFLARNTFQTTDYTTYSEYRQVDCKWSRFVSGMWHQGPSIFPCRVAFYGMWIIWWCFHSILNSGQILSDLIEISVLAAGTFNVEQFFDECIFMLSLSLTYTIRIELYYWLHKTKTKCFYFCYWRANTVLMFLFGNCTCWC